MPEILIERRISMKINYKLVLSLATAGIVCGMTRPCAAGPNVYITPPPPPTVVITAPAPTPPAVTVAVVPDYYVYDGTEYVAVVNDQYYYLGPDNAWIIMDPVRMHRFQGYMHDHPDWRSHMTHNEKYRNQDRDRDRDRTEPARDTHSKEPLDDHKDHYNDHTGPP
jgi:hypothetical protein